MAHVAAWKKTLVQELAQEMIDSPVVAIVDVHGIGGQQIQSMRAGLRGHAIVKMTKNNLILLALEKAAESRPELKGLEDSGDETMEDEPQEKPQRNRGRRDNRDYRENRDSRDNKNE